MKNIFSKRLINSRILITAGIAAFTIALSPILLLSSNIEKVHASSNITMQMDAFNNTTQQGTWTDPVTAHSGQIIEYRIMVTNNGDQPAERVQVWGSTEGLVPQGPSNQLVITGRATDAAFGGRDVRDTATVNVTGQPEGLRYLPGHARLNGVTNLYNCPNTCDIPDIVLGGMEIGNVAAGDFVEVSFKASMTNSPVVSPSPSPSVSPTPTPTPTPTNISCAANQVVVIVNGQQQCQSQQQTQTNNNNQTNNQNVTVSVPQAAAPAVVKTVEVKTTELPKTGLPEAGLAITGLLPAGYALKRKFGAKAVEDQTANFIWEERELKK